MLEVRWDDVGVEGIWCKECNKLLAEIEVSRVRGFAIGECEHFKWEVESIRCFYDPDMYKDYCVHDLEYVKKLRKSFIIRFDQGEVFVVLVPRDEGEGEEE
jgi:hypothetical protein